MVEQFVGCTEFSHLKKVTSRNTTDNEDASSIKLCKLFGKKPGER